MSKKYKKSKTHYIKRGLNTITNSGSIYEVDYSTLGNTNIETGQNPTYSEGNFKIITNNDITTQKKYGTGDWVKPEDDNNSDEFWTLENLDEISEDEETRQTNKRFKTRKVTLNKDYSLLSTFAYYGSLVKLVESSILDIIDRFPASLWLVEGKQVVNPLGVDITSESTAGDSLKVMSSHYKKYEIVETNKKTYKLECGTGNYIINELETSGKEVTSFDIKNGNNGMVETVKINNYILNFNYEEDDKCSLINITYGGDVNSSLPEEYPNKSLHIRPKQEYIDEFFNSLDDFQKTLLNQYSNPRYTSTFKIPKEDETYGIYFVDKNFTWDTIDGWNLDVHSVNFNKFVDELMEAALYIDNFRADIIYRMMTHETIKNIESNSYYVDENTIDLEATEHIISALRIFGRSYDEIKKYIEGISYANNITYNNKNNLPTIYYKSYVNNVLGWNAKSIINSNDNTDVTDSLYLGYSKGYDIVDAEDEFLRRLILSSKYIMKSKGTKSAIESLMNLFGISRDKYLIKEYVYKVDNFKNTKEIDEIVKYNNAKNYTLNGIKYDIETPPNLMDVDISTYDDLNGLCITKHYKNEYTDSDCEECSGSGLTQNLTGEIICPKCGGLGKHKEYIGIPYFKGNVPTLYYQQKGGWYQESDRNVNMVETINDLYDISIGMLNEGDIYYVNIISENEETNYFVLKNIEKSTEESGWYNIKENEMDNVNIPLESSNETITISINNLIEITDNTSGNNPHLGNGVYDNGIDYLYHYGTVDGDDDNGKAGLFRYTILNSPECIHEENQYKNLKDFTFKLEKIIDTKKSWVVNIDKDEEEIRTYEDGYELIPEINDYSKECGLEKEVIDNIREVSDYSDDYKKIINVKEVSIEYVFDEEEENEFYETILPYLEELIPSTTIIKIEKKAG